MQIDMHYYGCYALARAAGVRPKFAKILAHSSQFVDDAYHENRIILNDELAVFPITTSHRLLDFNNSLLHEQWKVFAPFHFLPGNQPRPGCEDNFLDRMKCRRGSVAAQKVLHHALQYKRKSFGPYLAGIAAHVFADSYAHEGFSGLSNEKNRVRYPSIKFHVHSDSLMRHLESDFLRFKAKAAAAFAKSISAGHGYVATFPDIPYLTWEYVNSDGERVVRDNAQIYMEACRGLFYFFREFVKGKHKYGSPAPVSRWEEIQGPLSEILTFEGRLKKRVKKWVAAILEGEIFPPKPRDEVHVLTRTYDAEDWRPTKIPELLKNKKLKKCRPYQFILAAWKHRGYVLDRLLRDKALSLWALIDQNDDHEIPSICGQRF